MLRACNIWRNLIIIWRKIWYIALSPFVLEHFDRVTFQRMQTLLKVTSGPPPFFKSFRRWRDPQGAWLLLFLSEYHVIPSVHGTSGPPSWTCLCTWIFGSCIIPCKGAQFWSICVPIALHPVLYAESAAKLHHPRPQHLAEFLFVARLSLPPLWPPTPKCPFAWKTSSASLLNGSSCSSFHSGHVFLLLFQEEEPSSVQGGLFHSTPCIVVLSLYSSVISLHVCLSS